MIDAEGQKLIMQNTTIIDWSAVAAIYSCLASIFTPTDFVLVGQKN